jgi:hypothetical protein
MFSYLSRGYGTWEGIAKSEKPDSAISPVSNMFFQQIIHLIF